MYLHIGMNVYLRRERILAILPAAILSQPPETQPFLRQARIVEYDVPKDDAKACIFTDNHELHISNVNCRTLRQRWNARVV